MRVWGIVDVKLCSNENKLEKFIAKPNFKSRSTFTETLVAFHMKKINFFNKPICIGMSILELSKNLMYDFYYNVI